MRVGIIDLGTNTFNILIVEVNKNQPFKCLFSSKEVVMLGNEGLNEGYISEKAFDRAYSALHGFKKLLTTYNCNKVTAFGTSAIRSASNAEHFISMVADNLNIYIEPISGEMEAQYIYYGVKQAVEFTHENYLILDIGGGSNEFIIANKNNLLWKHSFALGGARLLQKFKPDNPITEQQIALINSYLESELSLLKNALDKYPITKLVGSSGAFDSFASIEHFKKNDQKLSETIVCSRLSLTQFNELYNFLINTTRKQRLKMPGLESFRVDTIVVAAIFTKLSLKLSKAKEIIQSAYSLKEGVAAMFYIKPQFGQEAFEKVKN